MKALHMQERVMWLRLVLTVEIEKELSGPSRDERLKALAKRFAITETVHRRFILDPRYLDPMARAKPLTPTQLREQHNKRIFKNGKKNI